MQRNTAAAETTDRILPDESVAAVITPLMADHTAVLKEPFPHTRPVNDTYSPDDEDEADEDDLILGDENEVTGDEEEYDVELEDDMEETEINEDDLVIDSDDNIDEDEDDDL